MTDKVVPFAPVHTVRRFLILAILLLRLALLGIEVIIQIQNLMK